MNHNNTTPITTEELLNGFSKLLKQFEEQVDGFAVAVNDHVKARQLDPLFEELERLLQAHKGRVDRFGAEVEQGLTRLDRELETTMAKCQEMLMNVEETKHNLARAIAGLTTSLQTETQLTLVERSAVVDDIADAASGLGRLVTEYFGSAKACQDFLYTRLEKQEELLHSDEKLAASFTILLKMREELVHGRLEKHEAFLKSSEDLLRSAADLIGRHLQLAKEAAPPSAST